MLSRTADSLYWTGRYMERADFLARILEAAIRLAALPAKDHAAVTAWAAREAERREEENRRLRRELAEARRANEILKAASAFFAAELDRPTTR